MTAAAPIRQADLERIFKAAKTADVPVRVEIETRGGKIVIITGPDAESEHNPWDDD